MSKKPETIQITCCDAPGCGDKIVPGGKRHMIVKIDRTMTLFKSNGDAFSITTLPVGDYHVPCGIETETKAIRSAAREDEKLPFKDGAK